MDPCVRAAFDELLHRFNESDAKWEKRFLDAERARDERSAEAEKEREERDASVEHRLGQLESFCST